MFGILMSQLFLGISIAVLMVAFWPPDPRPYITVVVNH